MTMTAKQVQQYVLQYLETTGCHFIEKSPAHVTVKLSPQADRELTNRPYYWGYVDRTGVEPETMRFTFIFDAEKMPVLPPEPPPGPGVSVIRIPREEVTYGSRRLDQFFTAAKAGGSYVFLFEQPNVQQRTAMQSTPYETWLCVNLKVEYACDMKREEIYSLGISLITGEIVENFCDMVLTRNMTPKLPANIHMMRGAMTLHRARTLLEQVLEKKLKLVDDGWAIEARERLEDELARIDSYYEGLLKTGEEEQKQAAQEQYNRRKAEITWQYEPRILVSVINCGIFHLGADGPRQTDDSR